MDLEEIEGLKKLRKRFPTELDHDIKWINPPIKLEGTQFLDSNGDFISYKQLCELFNETYSALRANLQALKELEEKYVKLENRAK